MLGAHILIHSLHAADAITLDIFSHSTGIKRITQDEQWQKCHCFSNCKGENEMSCNSAIYAANVNPQTITDVTSAVNFGQVIRAFGPNVTLSGGNVTVKNTGYYIGDTNFNVENSGTTESVITARVYVDGNEVPGTLVQDTVPAAASGVPREFNFTIPFMIKNVCCAEKTITVRVSATADVSITNAAILLHKI